MQVQCKQCNGTMAQESKTEGNAQGLAIGTLWVVGGVILTITGIGAIVGIPLIIYGLFQGGKRKHYWVCSACGYFFERAP
jgi:hypothetical protein